MRQRNPGREALPLIASGGLKNGLDLAKALALGAVLGGMALPLLRAYMSEVNGGEAGLSAFMAQLRKELTITMFMTGARTIPALRETVLRMDADFAFEVQNLHSFESGTGSPRYMAPLFPGR